ncbi:MAG: alpha/beta hydrolase [Mycobacteriales bacterium]
MAVELAYREAGTGLPLVLLHAFPLSSAMWLSQREGLSQRCRVITPDLRGFGGSDLGTDEPSLQASAADVVALLDRLELDQVVLGGLSMGGYTALALLRHHGDRVRGLILADTKASADAEQGRANRERIAQQVLTETAPAVLIDEVLPTLVGPTTVEERPEVSGRVRALVLAAPPAAVAWAQRAMAVRPDSFDVLRSCSVPALVVRGEEDVLSSASDAQAMVEALGDAALVTIPAAGHLSAVEDPDAFNRSIADFLDRF